MKILSRTPWYAEGLAFDCVRCGRCCAGPEEGYVWITPQEIERLSEFLGKPPEEVRRRYTRPIGRRRSLLETLKTKDCIFLARDEAGLSECLIYPIRPTQCRTWPFWPANLQSVESWCLAALRCPGINRGPLHEFDEIRRKRDQTRS